MAANLTATKPAAVGALLACTLWPAIGFAQDGGAPAVVLTSQQSAEAGSQIKKQATDITAGGPSSSSTFGNLARSIQIETDGDDTTASISLGLDRSHPLGQGRRNSDGSTRFSFATDTLNVTATAPLGKGGKPSLFDFDSLGDGTSLAISFARYVGSVDYFPANDARSLPALQSRLQSRCIDARSIVWVSGEAAGDPSKETLARLVATELRAKIERTKLELGHGPDLALPKLAQSDDPKIKALAAYLLKQCVEVPDDLLPTYGTDEEKAVRPAGGPNGLWFFGGRGKLTRTNYEYLVQAPLAKSDISHTGYKVEGFFGRIFNSGRTSLTGSFAYSRSYRANDEAQLCGPNPVPGQLSCFTGSLGAPVKNSRYTLAGEMRWLLPLGSAEDAPNIGLAPRVSYEFKSNAALFELPIYFAPNEDKALNGGLRFAYDTGKDDFAFGLFVGVPFSVFTN
ncbi:MAG TPA: hypothetical protein VHG29_13555 [Novosphingobium sp.]|nr:hypothetical protein [Novosphingobium sp.]